MASKKRFKIITAVYLFLFKNDKILLMRRLNTGFEDGNYGLPSGHVEDNETLTEALKREMDEEIGIKLNVKKLELVHTMHRRSDDIRLDFFFTTKKYTGEPKNLEPEKCDDVNWFPTSKLPKNTIGYIKKALSSFRAKKPYSEINWK